VYSNKIVKIKIFPDTFNILVLFDNGITKNIDFKKKLDEEFCSDLRNKLLFQQARIDVGGYGLSWNDDIDISEFELWNIGENTNEKI
jgi:Protein of unknown function (DUF2442)